MNGKQLSQFFDKPNKIDAAASALIKQAVSDFPYAASLQVLYMKSLQNQESYQLPAQIKRAAIAVSDRSILKEFYDKNSASSEAKIEFDLTALRAQKAPLQKLDAPEKEVAAKKQEQTLDSEEKTGKQSTSKKLVKEAPKAPVVEEQKSEKQNAQSSAPPSNFDHLPEHVRNAILRSKKYNFSKGESAIEKSATEPPKENKAAVEVTANTPKSLSKNPSASQPENKAVVVEVAKEVASIPEVKEPSPQAETATDHSALEEDLRVMPFSERASFLDWLNAGNDSEVRHIDNRSTVGAPVDDAEAASTEPNEIRRIIRELPKIEKKELNTKINVFQLEAGEDGKFVTETLADIYLQQGLYSKAIGAYEVLSLKYPEKSSFFADRIRAIKKEENS